MRKAYQFLLSWRTLRKQLMKQHTIMTDVGTSLAVQWLRRLAANARGGGSTPSGRTGNLHAPQGGQKIKTKTLWQMYIYTRPSLVAQLVKNRLQCGRPGLDSWVGKISWRRERLPTSVFWPGEFHGLYSHGVGKSRTRLSDLHFTEPLEYTTQNTVTSRENIKN